MDSNWESRPELQIVGNRDAMADENSKRTRVEPAFSFLEKVKDKSWPGKLMELAGLGGLFDPRYFLRLHCRKEVQVPPSPARLAWMIENVDRLIPADGRRWREVRKRILSDRKRRDRALSILKSGTTRGVPKRFLLEGETHADCLIECANALLWIEGKRNDWLSPSTTWDSSRDQLARNVEAAWLHARGKEYCVILCHEGLKHHEEELIRGYCSGRWTAGWPQIEAPLQREFARRIGTVTWKAMVRAWPQLESRLLGIE